MMDMRERKYIKFRVDMYDDTKFKIIDRMPKRDLIHYVWSRIVVLAGKVNQDGDLYMSRNIPYTVDTLAIEFNRDIDEIKTALDVLMELEMIELAENKIYRVKNFAKHQNIKVKEKVEIKEKENEINNAENNKIEKDETKMDSEIEESLKNRISTEEKEEADIKANKNDEMSDMNFFKIDSNSENKSGNENKFDNENNVNPDKNDKNHISQHNNSPVILEMKKNQDSDKKNKKIKKKKIRDDIIELNENNELMNVVEEEKEEDFLCWITEGDIKPKEGERIISEWAF
jgi:predicted phage replisome organizer